MVAAKAAPAGEAVHEDHQFLKQVVNKIQAVSYIYVQVFAWASTYLQIEKQVPSKYGQWQNIYRKGSSRERKYKLAVHLSEGIAYALQH